MVGAAAPTVADAAGPSMLRHVALGAGGHRGRAGPAAVPTTSCSRRRGGPSRSRSAARCPTPPGGRRAPSPGASMTDSSSDRRTGTRRARSRVREPGGHPRGAGLRRSGSSWRSCPRRPTRAVPEDEWSNDLWRYRASRGRWVRLTSFPAGADRWTAIRTPVVDARWLDRVRRDPRAGLDDRLPRFSLWRLRDGVVERIASLPDERYLAGFDGEGARLWNVPDRANARVVDPPRDDRPGKRPSGAAPSAVDPFDVVDP